VLPALAGIGIGHASLITDPALVTNPLVVDFNQFTGLIRTLGPLDVGQGVTFTGDCMYCGTGHNIGWQTVSLGGDSGNGLWTSFSPGTNDVERGGFLTMNGTQGDFIFTFDYPVDSAIFLFDHGGTQSVVVSALDQQGNTLESWTADSLNMKNLDGAFKKNVGAWAGISRPQNDIYALNVWDGGGLVVDDLTFGRAAAAPADAPEPASMALLACGVALLAFRVKRSA
jgi:hypothetical protein